MAVSLSYNNHRNDSGSCDKNYTIRLIDESMTISTDDIPSVAYKIKFNGFNHKLTVQSPEFSMKCDSIIRKLTVCLSNVSNPNAIPYIFTLHESQAQKFMRKNLRRESITRLFILNNYGNIFAESDWLTLVHTKTEQVGSSGTYTFNNWILDPHKSNLNFNDICLDKDGNITLQIQVYSVSPISLLLTEEDAQTYSNESDEINTTLIEMLKDNEFKDLELVVGTNERKSILTHKAVLGAQSPVFKKMLTTNMIEEKSASVEIPDFEPPVLTSMLEYLYTGKLKMEEPHDYFQMFRLADKYELNELRKLSELRICQTCMSEIYLRNIFEMLEYHFAPLLRQCLAGLIEENETELKKSKIFQDVIRQYPEVYFDIYLNDEKE